MVATTSGLPSARILASWESWEKVCRSFSPLPSMAFAVLSMNLPTELLDNVLSGPSSVASRDSCVLTSSHSIGTAVRSSGILDPLTMRGVPD